MPTRYYSNAAVPTTLRAGVSATATVLPVVALTGYPTQFPYVVTIDKKVTGKGEACLVTGVSGSDLTVTRGWDGTTPVVHDVSAEVSHDHTAADYAEPQARLDALESGTVSKAGGSVIAASAPAVKGLVVKAAASQSANLQEWQNSSGTVLSYVRNDGIVNAPGFQVNTSGSSSFFGTDAGDNDDMLLTGNRANKKAFVIRGAASQSANLQEWQNSSGTPMATVSSAGDLAVAPSSTSSGVYFGSVPYLGGKLQVQGNPSGPTDAAYFIPGAATSLGVVVRGAPSQTGNLMQWQSSSGAVLSGIDANGIFFGSHQVSGNTMNANVAPLSYPAGVTFMAASADGTWPTPGWGIIQTMRNGGDVVQTWWGVTSNVRQQRIASSGNNTWSAWVAF